MSLGPAHTTLVAAGCALAVVFALAGAARAQDDLPAAERVEKGDMVAVKVADVAFVTVEEVDLESGVSTLVRMERPTTGL